MFFLHVFYKVLKYLLKCEHLSFRERFRESSEADLGMIFLYVKFELISELRPEHPRF